MNYALLVLPDNSVLNFYRRPFLDEIEDIKFMDAVGIPMRLKYGVYQTMKYRHLGGKLYRMIFSISLN